jgi:homogentisate 1,2-dioxygenase
MLLSRSHFIRACSSPAGGASLHICMTPHGPDTKTFEGATKLEAEQVSHLPRWAGHAVWFID